MATYTNTSYVAKNVSTSGSTLTTVASATTAAIASLIVSNTVSATITCDVYFTRSAVNYYLVKSATIPAGGALEVIQGNRVVLIASDALVVVASAASSADAVASVLLAA
jgi:hypothetical protein